MGFQGAVWQEEVMRRNGGSGISEQVWLARVQEVEKRLEVREHLGLIIIFVGFTTYLEVLYRLVRIDYAAFVGPYTIVMIKR